MKTTLLFFAILLSVGTHVQAQKKKDLLTEIEKLRSTLQSTKSELAVARKQERISKSEVASMEVQVADLKATNDKLLKNMSNFTELSNKKANNLQISQEIIKEKDRQLNTINDVITKNDSTNLAVFSAFKNALGGDQLKISNGTIYVTIANTTLFGENDKSYTVAAAATPTLQKIATILTENPTLSVTVEGNSNALKLDGKTMIDNWDLSAKQAAAVVRFLHTEGKVAPKRFKVLGRSEYATEGIETATRIVIDPTFDQFYSTIKETMKNGAK